MGEAGRELMEERFDEGIVIEAYRELLSESFVCPVMVKE